MRDDSSSLGRVRGRFNAFQKTMLQWNAIHPYNAVHVVSIPGAPDLNCLRQVIGGTLGAWGLTGLAFDQARGTYGYRGGAARIGIETLPGMGSARILLCAEIERQLNTPFDLSGQFSPFRFFVVSRVDSFALGLVYLHAVADAQSIVLLMKAIVEDYTGRKKQRVRSTREISLLPRGEPLISHTAAFARKLAALPSLLGDLRSSCRPFYRDAKDLHNGFVLFRVRPCLLRRLIDAAKVWGITVNDLLLALLMKSCALLATDREGAKRRKKISVGCIVNTRRDLDAQGTESFGLFLGYFMITHLVPGKIGLKELAKNIGQRTLAIKKKKLYLTTSLELFFSRFALSLASAEGKKKLYQKHYPLWGGLTNMNINSLWHAAPGVDTPDYVRAVSTGPASPLVLSFTTAGKSANVGLSYRSTVFSASDIKCLVRGFLGDLEKLEVDK